MMKLETNGECTGATSDCHHVLELNHNFQPMQISGAIWYWRIWALETLGLAGVSTALVHVGREL